VNQYNKYFKTLNLGKKPGVKNKRYPLPWEDHVAAPSRVYVKERTKGFLDWGGLVGLLDKFSEDYAKFSALPECPQERERLRERGEICEKLAAKLYKLHETGYGLPERICACGQAYVAKWKQFCAPCAKKQRRASNLKAKRRQRAKAKAA
jgi:hypothetical protein